MRESVLKYILLGVLFSTILSCDTNSAENPEIEQSLYPVEEVSLVPGAENASITVNKGASSYLSVKIESVNNEEFSELGTLEAWCIDWRKPLDTNNGVYNDIKIFSTFQVEKWAKLNYLLNILDDLKNDDPELTYREIQIVVWALRINPEFNIDDINVDDLSPRFMEDGAPNFSIQKVGGILDIIEEEYSTFEPLPGTKYALVLETPADVQTIFAVVD